MNPNLETAIIEFLANEFHLQPDSLIPDTDFAVDLGLNPQAIQDLIARMQDSLDFILPEDKASHISTLGDLLTAIQPESDTHEPD